MTSSEASTRARDPHWRPFRRGDGHLSESRDWGGFDRVRRCRQMGLPPYAPPGVRHVRRRGRDGRRGDDRGSGQPHGRGRRWQHCFYVRMDYGEPCFRPDKWLPNLDVGGLVP